MTIKFSIDLAGFYPLNDYISLARLAEDGGFDELHVVDDLMYKPVWPLLTLIGANTSCIKLGPWLISPRIVHPAYHAANLAVFDLLTSGRAVCAIGRGGFFEFLGMGPPNKPLTMIREAVQMTRRLLAGDRKPFNGEIFQATEELALNFEPFRNEIPILIGTFGQKTCKMAGTIADGFVTSCITNGSIFRLLRDNFVAGASGVGRDVSDLEFAVSPLCSISRDREVAFAPMRRLLPQIIRFMHPLTEYAGISEAVVNNMTTAVLRGDYAQASSYLSDDHIRFFSTTGTPADVITQVEVLLDAGANHIAFGGLLGPNPMESIQLLATEVLPKFR